VALSTGFVDQSHFSRNFKRIVGVTAREFILQRNFIQEIKSQSN
jgi:AraC-like DNA-binding protein